MGWVQWRTVVPIVHLAPWSMTSNQNEEMTLGSPSVWNSVVWRLRDWKVALGNPSLDLWTRFLHHSQHVWGQSLRSGLEFTGPCCQSQRGTGKKYEWFTKTVGAPLKMAWEQPFSRLFCIREGQQVSNPALAQTSAERLTKEGVFHFKKIEYKVIHLVFFSDELIAYELTRREAEANRRPLPELVRAKIPFSACLQAFSEPENVDDFWSSALQAKSAGVK